MCPGGTLFCSAPNGVHLISKPIILNCFNPLAYQGTKFIVSKSANSTLLQGIPLEALIFKKRMINFISVMIFTCQPKHRHHLQFIGGRLNYLSQLDGAKHLVEKVCRTSKQTKLMTGCNGHRLPIADSLNVRINSFFSRISSVLIE